MRSPFLFQVGSWISLALAMWSVLNVRLAFGNTAECIAFNLSVEFGYELSQGRISDLEVRDPGSRYFELGSGCGGGGACVYRVIPSDPRSPYELKEYRKSETRDDDAEAFSFIRKVAPARSEVEVSNPQVVGKRSMILPDVEGLPLDSLLHNAHRNKISKTEREHLVQTWNHFVRQIGTSLGTRVKLDEPGTGDGLLALRFEGRSDGKYIRIWLKPDNVVVEAKTGRMFLVDPF